MKLRAFAIWHYCQDPYGEECYATVAGPKNPDIEYAESEAAVARGEHFINIPKL
jgi:hypothetical protein